MNACMDCLRPVGNTEDPYGQLCQRCLDNLRHMRNGTKTLDEVRIELLNDRAEYIRELKVEIADLKDARKFIRKTIDRIQREG